MTETKKVSLEDNFAHIEEMIELLEQEDVSLEDAFSAYSKGINLLKECNKQIDQVEKKVLKLNEDGQLVEMS